MTEETYQLLRSVDDPEACEFPRNFDWENAMGKVRALRSELVELTGKQFELDDQVQDASFFAQLTVYENQENREGTTARLTAIGIRFSAFGDLFTVYTQPGLERTEMFERVVEAVSQQGFNYVDQEALAAPYDGVNTTIRMEPQADWWLRYFDYL